MAGLAAGQVAVAEHQVYSVEMIAETRMVAETAVVPPAVPAAAVVAATKTGSDANKLLN